MSASTTAPFDAKAWATQYVERHMATDPGIVTAYYVPANDHPREVRLIYVNKLLAERNTDSTEPYIFGVDEGEPDEHQVAILDVTPNQWSQIEQRLLPIPSGWDLDQKIEYPRR